MRLRILSRVLLPAPLRPMMPTTSPFWMSKSTSLSAQNVSVSGLWNGFLRRCIRASPAVVCLAALWAMV